MCAVVLGCRAHDLGLCFRVGRVVWARGPGWWSGGLVSVGADAECGQSGPFVIFLYAVDGLESFPWGAASPVVMSERVTWLLAGRVEYIWN